MSEQVKAGKWKRERGLVFFFDKKESAYAVHPSEAIRFVTRHNAEIASLEAEIEKLKEQFKFAREYLIEAQERQAESER